MKFICQFAYFMLLGTDAKSKTIVFMEKNGIRSFVAIAESETVENWIELIDQNNGKITAESKSTSNLQKLKAFSEDFQMKCFEIVDKRINCFERNYLISEFRVYWNISNHTMVLNSITSFKVFHLLFTSWINYLRRKENRRCM